MATRRFSAPDWGHDHLTLDAIVAYVDDELAAGAHERAQAHLVSCPGCRAEVVAQRQARSVLRSAGCPGLPSSLLSSLRSIPVEAELPPPPAGLGITADGQFVVLRDVPPDPGHEPAVPRRFSRRARVGAVSGLALGALAVGALAAPTPPVPAPAGVLGGGAVPIQARLSAVPAGPAAAVPAVADATEEPSTSDTAVAPSDDPAVLDAHLRARLERTPVAFYHRGP